MRRGDSVPGGTCVATSSTASPTIPRSLGTSSRIALRVTCSWRVTSERGQRFLGGPRDGEQGVELGELEQRLQVGVETREPQLPTLFANLLRERNQDAESRRIDVAGFGKIDDELPGAFLERIQDLLLQLLAVADDELAFYADDDHSALILLQSEAHRLPPPRLQDGDRRSVHNIIGRRATRQVRNGPRQSLQNRAERGPATKPLHEFVADVPGVEIGENQDVGATGGGRSRRLACRDGGHQRGVELELSIEGEIGFARPQLGHTGNEPIDPRPAGAALRAIRKESDDGLVLDDQPALPRRRERDVGQLARFRLGADRRIGEREHAVVLDHVKGARHGRDARRRPDCPQRRPYRFGARVHRAAKHDVGGAHPHETRPKHERMLQCLECCSVGWKLVRSARSKQGNQRASCVVRRACQKLNASQTLALNSSPCFLNARILPLGEDDASLALPRPLVDAVQKLHLLNLRFRACCTVGSTSCDTSPPKRATSRTRLELTKVRSKAGTRKTVSIFGARLRFINAIWNSYSKSDTARNPRMITDAPTFFANSASSPSNACTSTRLSA